MKIFACNIKNDLIRDSIEIFKNFVVTNIEFDNCLYKDGDYKPDEIAKIRIINPDKNELNLNPTSIEIDFEKEKIELCKCGRGIIYSGINLANYLQSFNKIKELNLTDMPIFITMDYIATFDENDKRWHLRYAIFFFPTIISIPGIIEAPAKPREYYFYYARGVLPEMMPEELKARFLKHNDSRLPRVLAGILLQAYFYYNTGFPFCNDPCCSLYNAHWQEDLINSQKDDPYVLCKKHKKIAGELKN